MFKYSDKICKPNGSVDSKCSGCVEDKGYITKEGESKTNTKIPEKTKTTDTVTITKEV